MNDTVLAAGVICWRKQGAEPQVLLIHRPNHRDISFPKGKLDLGESLPEAAVREVLEETGFSVSLDAPLALAEYELPGGRPKQVYYWSAFISKKQFQSLEFTPNDEVSQLSWVGFPEAEKLLSYRRDIEILGILKERIEKKQAKTFPVIALRHAKARLPENWSGDDDSRPLRSRGREEVVAMSRKIYPYGPRSIITSPAIRCQQTVAQIAEHLNITPVIGPTLGQNQSSWFEVQISDVIGEVLEKQVSTVICSHAPVIPGTLQELVTQTQSPLTREIFRSAILNTAEFVVVHLSKENGPKIVAIERYNPRSIASITPFGEQFTQS